MKKRQTFVYGFFAVFFAFVVTACPEPDDGGGDHSGGGHIHDWGDWTSANIEGTEERTCKDNPTHIEHRLTGTNRFTFEPIGSTAYRIKQGTAGGVVRIPAYYRPNENNDFQPVTEIGKANDADTTGAFRNSTLTTVHIPDTVTTIGNYAFFSCTLLTGVTIPASVNAIGNSAFILCANLTGFTVDPGNDHYIGEDALLFNKEKTEIVAYPSAKGNITIPDNIVTIGENVFYGCTGLTGITLPASVKSIGNYAFYGCTSLAGIDIRTGITSIGNNAFQNCAGLTRITISESVTLIGNNAFEGCTGLPNITIPVSVTTLGYGVFKDWTAQQTVFIETYNDASSADAAWGQGWRANCSAPIIYGQHNWGNWTSKIAPTITTDGEETRSCTHGSYTHTETRILYATGTPGLGFNLITWEELGGGADGTYALVSCPIDAQDVYIPAYYRPNANSEYLPVTEIHHFAFADDDLDPASVTIPASVTVIFVNAFSRCPSLTSITVAADNPHFSSAGGILYNKTKTALLAYPSASGNITIPAGVTSIGNKAFIDCANLSGVTIPAGVTAIDGYAFAGCENLANITIPASVVDIGNYTFAGCNSLTSITVDANNPNYASEGGILYNKTKTTLLAYPSASGDITIPAGVTAIGLGPFSEYFYHNKNLISVILPEGVTSIGDEAFSYCEKLASITLPSSLTSIGAQAFLYCSYLVSITLPEGLTFIGSDAFNGQYDLTEITIPASVTSVGIGAFRSWPSSKTIYVKGFASQAAADAAWGESLPGDSWRGDSWRLDCDAVIKYWNGSSYQ